MKRCTYPYCGDRRETCEMCNSTLGKAAGPFILFAAFLLALLIVSAVEWVAP